MVTGYGRRVERKAAEGWQGDLIFCLRLLGVKEKICDRKVVFWGKRCMYEICKKYARGMHSD